MEAIRTQLLALGVDASKFDDETVRKIAKAMNIAVPRQVEIVEYKGARYVKTENFAVPGRKENDKPGTARNLFLRVEAVDQALADLLEAKGLLTPKA